MKEFLRGYWIGTKARWRNAPILNALGTLIKVWFWSAAITHKKLGVKGWIKRLLIANLLLLPLTVYYYASGKFTKTINEAIEEL